MRRPPPGEWSQQVDDLRELLWGTLVRLESPATVHELSGLLGLHAVMGPPVVLYTLWSLGDLVAEEGRLARRHWRARTDPELAERRHAAQRRAHRGLDGHRS